MLFYLSITAHIFPETAVNYPLQFTVLLLLLTFDVHALWWTALWKSDYYKLIIILLTLFKTCINPQEIQSNGLQKTSDFSDFNSICTTKTKFKSFYRQELQFQTTSKTANSVTTMLHKMTLDLLPRVKFLKPVFRLYFGLRISLKPISMEDKVTH